MRHALLARKCESAAAVPSSAARSNLRISEPGDAFEQEADRVADEVMANRAGRPVWTVARLATNPIPQSKCACGGCGGLENEDQNGAEKEAGLQRKGTGLKHSGVVPPAVHASLDSPGRQLAPEERNFFGLRFGHDFSKVRIHTDGLAAESARAVNARAYTVGNHIVFGAGQFAPATRAGRRLMAHELTHVVQQSSSRQSVHGIPAFVDRDAGREGTGVGSAGGGPQFGTPLIRTGTILARDTDIIRDNPYHPSPKVPDLDEDEVKKAEQAVAANNFQQAIDILLKEAVSIHRVDSKLLEGGTMHFDPQLNQEGLTLDPTLDRSGQPQPAKVTIGPPAFKKGVSWLYSTLLHEFVHVQQDLPIGSNMPVVVQGASGDPSSSNAKEVEAYAFEITHGAATGLNATPTLISELWGRLCHAYSFLMPFRRRSMESLAKKAQQAAEKIVGQNKLLDCVKNP